MGLMAFVLPLATLLPGVLITWLMMKNQLQGKISGLNAQLAEKAARCDFVEQAHGKTVSELAVLDEKYRHLQDENYALGNRFSAAEKQIAHLQEKEAESVRLKQSYIDLQEKAQGLAVENERLATQLGQERKAFRPTNMPWNAKSAKESKPIWKKAAKLSATCKTIFPMWATVLPQLKNRLPICRKKRRKRKT
ncbi:hypothetical protein NEILACOT_04133 [Neisseria lactamica ATCC 23970]|uniref:Uncharacterized protein n=1 Tax=Neisseria lactamica ATCC 23970 TaxID=546265 RepID=D0W9C4_NEILA|nr:hypothetical protein NEILACOT_04133 [Neisseria lactamica ATCC 23970]